jgi:four helix bundle protein
MEQGSRSKDQKTAVKSFEESGFRRVIAWQKADDLLAACYRLAGSIPARDYRLRAQFLGAARSVSSNIAEGHRRGTVRDYVRFLEIAMSSLNEVENDLHIIKRNEIVASSLVVAVEPIRLETGKVLAGLLRAMRRKMTGDGEWQRRELGEERPIYVAEQEFELDEEFLSPVS